MTFTQYSGPASDYPSQDTWVAWPDIFNIFTQSMLDTGDTEDDIGRIFVGITTAAQQIGVDERVILCIIIKESSGNVGIDGPHDADGNVTGGLMQAEESQGFPGQHDLPQDETVGMIMAGTQHFKGNLQQLGDGDDATTIYQALRLYNTGRVNPDDLNDDWTGVGDPNDPNTHSDPNYVSTIANYLQGMIG